MKNVFDTDQQSHYLFSWGKLGDIKAGREHLGDEMPVVVYRMLEYSLNNILFNHFGSEKADELLREAGKLAGSEYAKNVLPLDADEPDFVSALTESISELKIGILRVEKGDFEHGTFTIAVHEDIDCSGLPVSDELVCCYDEGFISGILETYIKKPIDVKEVECWANGSRVCRFEGKVKND